MKIPPLGSRGGCNRSGLKRVLLPAYRVEGDISNFRHRCRSAPARTRSAIAIFGPELVGRLEFIRRAQAAGLSLREVRQVLAIADRGDRPCGHVVYCQSRG